jgi:carbonic anhydrase
VRPARRLAVLTCMDVRVDPLGILGLSMGDAHVLRNAGGRVTEDVLRSLALSSNVLGVTSVVVMHHTRCGLAGASDVELRVQTGADVAFLTIGDHDVALEQDIDAIMSTPFLEGIESVSGVLYDVDTHNTRATSAKHRFATVDP